MTHDAHSVSSLSNKLLPEKCCDGAAVIDSSESTSHSSFQSNSIIFSEGTPHLISNLAMPKVVINFPTLSLIFRIENLFKWS